MEPLRDIIRVKIAIELERDPEWRAKVKQHLSGEGITNQGRVRSDNIAIRQVRRATVSIEAGGAVL